MGSTDVIVILLLLLIVGGASYYIIRAKKNGKRCIGCPDSASCQGMGGCKGHCHSCTHECGEHKDEK